MDAIHNFMTSSINEEHIDMDDFGNLTFEAKVEYKYMKKKLTSITTVKIIRNGYDDGKISLRENDELNVNFLHLDFTPQYQDYEFDDVDNSLNITGSSPKMNGSYSVKININWVYITNLCKKNKAILEIFQSLKIQFNTI